ncbi:MAG: serine/threonine-protein kinase [Myxococcota bacterium]
MRDLGGTTVTGARGPARSPRELPEEIGFSTVGCERRAERRARSPRGLGSRLGHFCRLEPVGEGGMGTVYAAYDERLGRRVALKVIRGEADAQRRARMLREAQALAKLSHPHVVAVYEVGEYADELYIAMELVQGQTLGQWVKGRPVDQVLRMYVQAGRGLAAAHRCGLVHRDFKPSNVVVGPADGDEASERARVLDFGLARLGDELSTSWPPDEDDEPSLDPAVGFSLDESLTATGSLVGTPAYMAPEQFMGRRASAHTDQFSFCVSLYEGLYGERPFEGHDEHTLAHNITGGRIRPVPRAAAVPAWLRKILLRGLAVDPRDRYRSMDALLAALERDPRRRRRATLLVASGVFVVAGLSAWPSVQRVVSARACAREGAEIFASWNDERAGTLAAAFDATGLAHAPQAWAHTQAKLDVYAEDWARQRRALCVAVEVEQVRSPGELARARECFDDARFGLEALVDRLGAPEAVVVRDAPLWASKLQYSSACSDPELLRARADPPHDEATRAAILPLRERLSRVTVDLRFPAGSDVAQHALAEAEAVLVEAEALGWAPLVARAQYVVGLGLQILGRPEQAEPMYERAFFTAGHAGLGQVALSASNALMTVVGPMLHRPHDALRWSRQGRLELDRLGLDDELPVAAYLSDLGNVHNARGEYAEALGVYQRALAILERHVGPHDLAVAQYLRPVAYCHSMLGDQEAALQAQQRATSILEHQLPGDHPMMARALNVIAGIQSARGQLDQALDAEQRAVDIATRAFGAEHPHVLATRRNLGAMYWRRGSYAAALAIFEGVREIEERQHGPESPALVQTLNMVGVAQLGLGDAASARASHRRALVLAEAHLEPEHPELARTLVNLALAEVARGQPEAALAAAARGLAIWEATVGSEHPEVATALLARGDALMLRGTPGEAVPVFERALAIRADVLSAGHPDIDEARQRLERSRRELSAG